MRVRSAVFVISSFALLAPATASADFVHVVGPGESLSSVAAADGLSVGALAAANGLSPTAELITGTGIQIPPQDSAAPVAVGSSATGDGDGDSDDVASSPAAPVNSATASVGGGSYVVQPGDTLTAIAARAGMSIAQLAADNGIDPNGLLFAGSVLRLGGSGSTTLVSSQSAETATASTQPVGAPAEGSAVNPPYPTPESVSPSEVGSIAAANGVPASLADAIAYQESGFNNDEVSTADARGEMQILPGTWDWIQQTLVPGGSPLAPASAVDNVRGGVLLLRSLLNSTGGDPAMAAAGYYQGLPSVERYGVYPSTQQYVNDVMSEAQRFGGG
ncbi:MAG TPA: LysM peptidoglycan-binding domain-containing protein [Solirubrobacteraceae bacterium]|nr:LysM peptidoglycan-binding domain-containing protein [Solirubrobacteraceae bacterium]